MALRKKGSIYYIYYNDGGKRVERSTGMTDKRKAQFMERQVMRKRQVSRVCERLGIDVPANEALLEKRTLLTEMPDIASKHRKVTREMLIYWRRFSEKSGFEYADEATPRACQAFLDREYGKSSAKTYNNSKTYLHTIFRACFGETGVSSPFADLLNRKNGGVEHHRAYTDEEIGAILSNSTPFWRFMVTLSLNTGMAKETCLRFCPDWIEEKDGVKWARFTRSKTARFGRCCLVPLKDIVLEQITPLQGQIKGNTPFVKAFPHSTYDLQKGFAELLAKCGIKDSKDGRADFHSLRATFISRCRAAGIADHAIRSMVGHVSSQTTDVYSHDMFTPLRVLDMCQ